MLTGDLSFVDGAAAQARSQNLYAAKKVENGRIAAAQQVWRRTAGTAFPETNTAKCSATSGCSPSTGRGSKADHDPWIRYLEGKNPGFPFEALQGEMEGVRRRVAGLREDHLPREERPSDHSQRFNPARTEALVNLVLGGNHPGTSGNILHSRLLYFDPARDRVGLPEDVAALVETITPQGLRLRLVNVNPVEPRTVIVQAGAYGEHRFGKVGDVAVNGNAFEAQLAPGSGGVLEIGLELWKNAPKLRQP